MTVKYISNYQNTFQGTKIFKYCTCPAGRVTYNFHLSCKLTHALDFKSVCNKEHKGVICSMTSLGNFFQSTCPTGRMLWEELLVLSRFHSLLRADEWNFCLLHFRATHHFQSCKNLSNSSFPKPQKLLIFWPTYGVQLPSNYV